MEFLRNSLIDGMNFGLETNIECVSYRDTLAPFIDGKARSKRA